MSNVMAALPNIVTVPEISLLVVLGCGLGWVMCPNLCFVMGWVGSVSWLVGLGWGKENGHTDPSNSCSMQNKRCSFWIRIIYFTHTELDSMHWFSHQHSHTPEDRSRKKTATRGLRPRGQLRNKMLHFFFFCPQWPWPLTFNRHLNLGEIFAQCTSKFHHPTFNRSADKVDKQTSRQTNRQTDKQTDATENIQLTPRDVHDLKFGHRGSNFLGVFTLERPLLRTLPITSTNEQRWHTLYSATKCS